MLENEHSAGRNQRLGRGNRDHQIGFVVGRIEHGQIDRIRAFRSQRDAQAVERALAEVRAALKDDKRNVMPPIVSRPPPTPIT